jgi:hypothetical protein
VIVRRWTHIVKPGCTKELIDLLHEGFDEYDRNLRICTSHTGPNSILTFELEYEDLSDYQQSATEWWAVPENTARYKRYVELVESGGMTEFWNLH